MRLFYLRENPLDNIETGICFFVLLLPTPNLRNSDGTTIIFRNVAVMRPPRMTPSHPQVSPNGRLLAGVVLARSVLRYCDLVIGEVDSGKLLYRVPN